MKGEPVRRRDFLTLLGVAATGWPIAARAQQSDRIGRIGVFMNLAADDPEGVARILAFRRRLQELGWVEGSNLRIDYRWGAGDAELYHRYAAELVALKPEVILASNGPITAAVQQESRTMQIVFTATIDPVGSGRVETLARPGANATGFASIQFSITGKLLELLTQIAPSMTRAAIILDLTGTAGINQLRTIQAIAPSLGVELSPVDVRDPGEIEQAVTAFAGAPNGGVVVPQSTLAVIHRGLIITLAARHGLPAAYSNRLFVNGGGLISYGPLTTDLYGRAADYVARILKGEKAADLPVQQPTKFELVINLTTAKTLGLVLPRRLIAAADDLIERK
jgi:putative ABC transport system substrate-binding protein